MKVTQTRDVFTYDDLTYAAEEALRALTDDEVSA